MPTKLEIQEQIRVLWDEYEHIPTPEALREKALVVYTRKMLEELRAGIFNEGIDALKLVLNDNWRLVNGTALSPTAIPEADITKLFCDVAEFVADEYNKTNPVRIAAIQLLMPSITVESIRPDLFDDASKVIGEGYLNLTVRPLREILKTHILGREGQFLLPVKLLTELSLNLKIEALMNPYVPEDAMTQDIYYAITSEEYARLVAHSPLTQAVGEAHQQYQRIANDNSNLLGQLNELCVKLAVNDARGGLGSEENAGTGAYAPIIIFNDYYDKLTVAQKNSLPKPLIQEIEKLLTVASNPEANINATENLETCIFMRRQKLQAAAQGNEAILEGISISGSQRESLISASIALFHKTKEELTRHLASSSYQYGRDNLGLNCQLLESLGLKFNLVSLEDLNIFKVLSADEMIELLQDDELGIQLITQIHSLENLVILIMELSSEKATAILSGSKRAILNLLVRTSQDLSALLISLEPERCAVVIDAMKSELPNIIKTGDDFRSILNHLTYEQSIVVFDSMKSELPNIIKTSHAFRDVLNNLTPEQRTVVIDAMKSELPRLIKTGDDFIGVVNNLTPEQCTVVYDAMKSELPNIIKMSEDFEFVLCCLSPEQRTAVLDVMKSELPKIIKTGIDFRSILCHLTPKQCAVVFGAMKSELPKLIETACDFGHVLYHLTPEQRAVVFDAMKSELPKIIKAGDDFNKVLICLVPEQRTAVYDAMKSEWPKIIKAGDDFNKVLIYLAPEQRTAVYDAMKSEWPKKIKTSDDFRIFLSCLSSEQCVVVIDAIKSKLPSIIKTGWHFRGVLKYLSPEQRTVVYDAMKSELPNIIKMSEDFELVLHHLSPEQCAAVFDAMKSELPKLINTRYDLSSVLIHLTPEQFRVVIDVVKSKLPNIIKMSEDFEYVLRHLRPEQHHGLCDVILKNQTALNVIASADARAAVCPYLSLDQNEILKFIERMPKIAAVGSFVSALIDNEHTAIKTSFMALIRDSKSLNDKASSFWSKENSPEDLVLSIVALGPHWKGKIMAALELKFPEGMSPSSENFKTLLESYIHDEGLEKTHNTSLMT